MAGDRHNGAGPPTAQLPADGRGLAVRLRAAGCVRAEDEASLLLAERWDAGELERRVRRRELGEPLEWLLGWAEFGGLLLNIEPGVFIPRQRTVTLAEKAAALVASAPPPRVVLDACTGCGAIACFVARHCRGALVLGGDVDPAAVRCARRNGRRHGVHIVDSDLLAGFPGRLRGRVRVVVANVPYVPDGELERMPTEAREWEPRSALAGGVDGLAVLRELAAQADRWLAPGGALLTEIAPSQATQAAADIDCLGYASQVIRTPPDDDTVLLAATLR